MHKICLPGQLEICLQHIYTNQKSVANAQSHGADSNLSLRPIILHIGSVLKIMNNLHYRRRGDVTALSEKADSVLLF